MTISGNLRSLELSELLQWLSQGRKTGTLVVRNAQVEKQVILRNGRIISSASTDPKEHLGEFLVDRGYIDRSTLDHARKLQEATQIFLGKVLVTLDSLSQVDLERVMREKTEESLYELFLWQEGDFEFLRDQLPSLAMVPLSLDVTRVVMEGLRRLDERNRSLAGDFEDPASVEAARLEKELETVPLADLVAGGAPPPSPDQAAETWQRAELREEALAALPHAGRDTPEPEAVRVAPVAAAAGEEEKPADGAPAPVAPAVEMPSESQMALLSGSGAYAGALSSGSGSRRAVYLVAAAILVAGAAGWAFFALRHPSPIATTAAAAPPVEARPLETPPAEDGEAPTAGADLEVPAAVPPAASAEPAADSEAERLAAELDDLVAARSRELESSLKAEYEAKLARLERQLDAARRAADEARQTDAGAASPAAGPPDRGEVERASPAGPPPPLPGTLLASTGPSSPMVRLAAQRENAAAATTPATPEVASAAAGPAPEISAAGDATPAAPAESPPPRSAPTPAEPPAPKVREGDLVERGPGVVAPRLVAQPKPTYPPAALRVRRGGSVDVRVLVDETGRAAEVRQVGGKVGLGFDKAALDAAARTEWQPATLEGVRVATWVDLRIEFKP